jgi:hypothetical protein
MATARQCWSPDPSAFPVPNPREDKEIPHDQRFGRFPSTESRPTLSESAVTKDLDSQE